MTEKENQTNTSRRDFLKKTAYVAPAIATLTVVPAHYAVGSTTGGSYPSDGKQRKYRKHHNFWKHWKRKQ